MCSSSVLTVSLCLLLCLPPCLSSGVTVKPGEDVTLECRGSADAEITLLKWTKPDLESDRYVFFYREKRLYVNYQHPSYRGRVELKDPKMKDGDVSVVLKNVNFNDAGRYECYVGDTRSDLRLISSIHLKVQDSVNITAEPGQSVSLPCRAPRNTDIIVVEWTRPERETEYVLRYLDGKPVPENQHPSFKDRVDLKDGEMKDGDVSMILKKVTRDDSGTYECRVETKSRSGSSSGLFSIVYLEVQSGDTGGRGDKEGGDKEGGDKERGDKDSHVEVAVVVTLVVVVVAFIIKHYRKSLTKLLIQQLTSIKQKVCGVSCDQYMRPGSEGLKEPGSQTQDQDQL